MQQLISFLTTENEWFCNVLTPILAFFEVCFLLTFIKTIYKLNVSRSSFFICAFLMAILGSISKVILPLQYSSLINFLLYIILIIMFLKASIFKSIIGMSLFIGIIALVEYIINFTIAKIFQINILESTLIPIYKIFFTLILYLSIFMVTYIIKHCFQKANTNEDNNNKERFRVALIVLLIILIILPNYVFLIILNMNLPTIYVLYTIISAFIFFFVGLYSTYKVNKLQITTRELETANLYNSTLSKLVDSNRSFRHDMANIVNSIGGYLELNDIDGLKKYYKTGLLPEIQKSNNLSLLNPDVINSPPLFGLFLAKYNFADSLGVKIELNSFFDYSKINMNIFDFVKVFGILFDNAIEAASKCEDKIVSIHVTIDFYNRKQIFKISNTYLEKDIDVNKIFEKDYSTKEIKSGFGLWEVKQILKKHSNAKLLTSKNNDLFTQKLEIYF